MKVFMIDPTPEDLNDVDSLGLAATVEIVRSEPRSTAKPTEQHDDKGASSPPTTKISTDL